ncbi:MAG TPA: hypothetical protein VFH39_03585 [Candidatus Saccharimonadales bacterium]|nr:hypothetical protein [Candidatus Saccharimonadales bacterium]
MDDSPFLAIKSLETQLSGVLSRLDLFELPKAEQKLVDTLRRNVADARLDIRDYELSETRDEQLRKAQAAKKRLERVRKGVLAASEYNVFGAVDVAQLTAQLEQISDNLK